MVTAQARKKFELKATPAELRSKVLQVRDDLRTPASDPKPQLAELYAMVVAPFEEELKRWNRVPLHRTASRRCSGRWTACCATCRWRRSTTASTTWLERFNNVLFTPESYGHMTASPRSELLPDCSVLAMGLSKSYGGLPALPGVMPELDAVVHDPAVPESHGPMEGRLLPNEQFTLAALKTELGAGQELPGGAYCQPFCGGDG